jgi:hypothetical protein
VALGKIAVACLLAAAVSAARAQSVSLRGIVRDATSSHPLSGAVVTLSAMSGDRATRTDETGAFAFSKLKTGRYVLDVRRLGYEPSRQTVDLARDETVVITLTRVASLDTMHVRAAERAIFGVVGTARGLRPLPTATVQIIGAGGKVGVDSGGHFFVPLKAAGAYVVRAQADGYEPQTVSVSVPPDDAVEVALLLDSVGAPGLKVSDMEWADFDERLRWRRNGSAFVPRTDLLAHGNGLMVDAIRTSRSFASRALRFGSTACVFVDGTPHPGWPMSSIDPADVEAVELYTERGDETSSLAKRWPHGQPCADTGVPPAGGSRQDIVKWVVIWLKR